MPALHTRASALGLIFLACPLHFLRVGALTSRSVDKSWQDLELGPTSQMLTMPQGNDGEKTLAAVKDSVMPPATGVTNYHQAMSNFADAQYVAYVDIGEQTIGAVLDTGSFELVVFSNTCYSCGQAAKYSSRRSSTYAKGKMETEQAYGSGTAFSHDASDFVSLGPFGSANQTFWEVLDADMPVLADAKFNAVVGLGPPETPAVDAWSSAEAAAQTIIDHIGAGIMENVEVEWAMNKYDLAFQSRLRGTVLHTFGVGSFSICIGATPGSDGHFIWNDTSHMVYPERFVRLPVTGAHTWTVDLAEVKLAPRLWRPEDSAIHVGCSEGCSAMIDSGTALLVVPRFAVDALAAQANKLDDNCSNIQDLPELVFKMGGTEFSLPPDAYIAEVTGHVPSYMQSFLQIRRLRNPKRTCELVVMESTAQSNSGPLFILGLPFLRSHYSTFAVGPSTKERAVYVAPATETCTPGDLFGSQALTRLSSREKRDVMKPFWRRMDPSKMMMPRAALKATTSLFVKV